MRLIIPIILIGVSVTVFVVFANPFYKDIKELRAQVVSYDDALEKSKELEKAQEKLTAKSNSIDPVNLGKLQKLLPENIDNIRLILEIEQIASPFGMILKDVKYSPTDTKKETTKAGATTVQGEVQAMPSLSKDYGIWDLSFSTTGTYNNFLNFTRALENNLRIVDITSVNFSSDATSAGSSPVSKIPDVESYKYDFNIKTYWLKN